MLLLFFFKISGFQIIFFNHILVFFISLQKKTNPIPCSHLNSFFQSPVWFILIINDLLTNRKFYVIFFLFKLKNLFAIMMLVLFKCHNRMMSSSSMNETFLQFLKTTGIHLPYFVLELILNGIKQLLFDELLR